jgi:Protein of unknown function (DUF3108)
MNAAIGASSQAAPPWRGLSLALLLALLTHFFAFMLVNGHFAFSVNRPDPSAVISTRMIDLVPMPVSPVTPAPSPAPSQRSENASTAPQAAPAAKPPVASAAEKTPVDPPKIEPNPPAAGAESARNATETVATITPSDSPSTTATSVPFEANALPAIKLSYPASAKLQFEGTVMRKGTALGGNGVLDWKIDGSSYELSLEASALLVLSRTEKSVGLLSPQGLAPQRYSSSGTGRSEQATHFRREIGKIQFSNNKPDEILLVGAQDQLSALVQLAGIIGGDPERYRIVNRIQMQVAGLSSAEVWEFSLEGVSDINLPAANMQALKLSRSPRNEFDQRLELWLSPQLGYLPIRIRQSSSTAPEQDFTDLRLRKIP